MKCWFVIRLCVTSNSYGKINSRRQLVLWTAHCCRQAKLQALYKCICVYPSNTSCLCFSIIKIIARNQICQIKMPLKLLLAVIVIYDYSCVMLTYEMISRNPVFIRAEEFWFRKVQWNIYSHLYFNICYELTSVIIKCG